MYCLRLVCTLIVLATLAGPAWCHSDLLAQIEALDLKIQQQDANVELLIKRGDLYRRHQDYPAAARDFEAAGEVDPDYVILDFYQGRLLLESGQAAGAHEYLSRYVKSQPEHAKAWILLGEASIILNRPVKAAEYFSTAIQASKSPSPDMYRQLILSHIAIGPSNWPAALEAVNAGLQQFGSEVTLLGLGVDISLASNLITQADHYLNKLPEPLFRLPQWATRMNLKNCLTVNEPSTEEDCRIQARERLSAQLSSFLKSNETVRS